MNDSDKLKRIEGYIHVQTAYHMTLLLEKDLPDYKKDYLQGRLDMLNAMNKDLFNGKAQIDF
jgi:hypothetical protein